MMTGDKKDLKDQTREAPSEDDRPKDLSADEKNRLGQFEIEPERSQSKVGGSPMSLDSLADNDEFDALIKVLEEDYVPQGVAVRAQISPTLMTTRLRKRALADLEHDPKVVSIEPSSPLPSSEKESGED